MPCSDGERKCMLCHVMLVKRVLCQVVLVNGKAWCLRHVVRAGQFICALRNATQINANNLVVLLKLDNSPIELMFLYTHTVRHKIKFLVYIL